MFFLELTTSVSGVWLSFLIPTFSLQVFESNLALSAWEAGAAVLLAKPFFHLN